jgi:hypothetical protein
MHNMLQCLWLPLADEVKLWRASLSHIYMWRASLSHIYMWRASLSHIYMWRASLSHIYMSCGKDRIGASHVCVSAATASSTCATDRHRHCCSLVSQIDGSLMVQGWSLQPHASP